MTALPTWLVVVLSLAPSFVALVAIVAAEIRERNRQKFEQAMKLREDRLQAYSTLARLTKSMDVRDPLATPALAEVLAEIEILTNNPELRKAADGLIETWSSAWQSARNALEGEAENPYNAPGYLNVRGLLIAHRRAFIRFAKEELGQKPEDG